MSQEIELKIPLTQNEYNNFYENVFCCETDEKQFFNNVEFYSTNKNLITKSDEFYSRYTTRKEREENNEPSGIRLRVETETATTEIATNLGTQILSTRAYFTIKRKSSKNGIEINEENETFIKNSDVLKQFFEVAGYKCWFKKVKTAYSCYADYEGLTFHVELVKVNNLPYIEIEVVSEQNMKTDSFENVDSIATKLEDFVKVIGFDPSKKDARSWRDILEQVE